MHRVLRCTLVFTCVYVCAHVCVRAGSCICVYVLRVVLCTCKLSDGPRVNLRAPT